MAESRKKASPDKTALDSLATEVIGLRDDVVVLQTSVDWYERSVTIEKRVRRRADFSIGFLCVVAIAAGIYAGVTTGQLRNIASKNRKINAQNSQILGDIEAVTGPSAQAAQRQQLTGALEAIDQRQHQELQNALDAFAALLGKPAPVLPPVAPVVIQTPSPAAQAPVTQPPTSSPVTTTTSKRALPPPTTLQPTTTIARQPTSTTILPKVCVNNVCLPVLKAAQTVSAQPAKEDDPLPMTNIPFGALAAFGALIFTFINFGKYITNRSWSPAATQLVVWIAGVGATLLVAQTQFSNGIAIGGISLAKMSFWSDFFFGLMAGSLPSTAFTLVGLHASQPTAATAKLVPFLPHVIQAPDAVPDPVHTAEPRRRPARD